MEFLQLLVGGRARQIFLTYTIVHFIKPNSRRQDLFALFYNLLIHIKIRNALQLGFLGGVKYLNIS